MLVELKNVRQEGGTLRRRWFSDDGMELILWYAETGEQTGFQICYAGADREERALTWRSGRGFSHARIDSGEDRPDKNMTPILMKDGAVPWGQVEEEFSRRSAALEPALRDYVLQAFNQRAG